jgi:formylglycine-generating enzyme required for sulfatase activity
MKPIQLITFSLYCLLLAKTAFANDDRNLVVNANSNTGKRIALVIGNGDYQHTDSLPKLSNPPHDAEDIAKALRGFGFEVIEREDINLEDMNNAIAEFSRKIGNSDAALFYFAGHGLQVKGQNYLVPVDANIETEARVQYVSVNVNQILDEMDGAHSHANIVMLDACRNNPISGRFRSAATRGLAVPSTTPKGTVIVYATDPGNTAADGDGRNGLFTKGLLDAFKGNDLSLHGILVRASREVGRISDNKQTPYVNGPMELQDDFHFSQGTQVANLEPVAAPEHVKTTDEIEQETWESARDSNDIEVVNDYLKQYPRGKFVGLANILYRKLKKESAEAAVQAHRTSKVFMDCPDCPEMVVIPAGSFEMGSNSGEAIEKPVHRVTITRPFALGKTEVTQGQWKAIMGNNPSKFSNCGDNCPVEQVSWNDAQEFIDKLNLKTAKKYRLPSEAEWEYACRAGGEHIYCGSDNLDSVGWYGASTNQPGNARKTNPVGLKQANAFGLYDMSGNVWEWVEDSYHDNYIGAPTDGSAWSGDGATRVLRGGSWGFGFQEARSALRGRNVPTNRNSPDLGFRLAKTLSVEPQPATQQAELPNGYISQGGLTWMPINSSTKTWEDANAYCSNTAINGQNGWRLPMKDELSALYNSGAMNAQGRKLVNTWSSTPGRAGSHYVVLLDSGGVLAGLDSNRRHVTCVR